MIVQNKLPKYRKVDTQGTDRSDVGDKKVIQFWYVCKKHRVNLTEWISRNELVVNDSISADSPKYPGYTPLHFAVKCNNRTAVTLLLACGADFTLKNARGQTPLHLGMTMILLDGKRLSGWKRNMQLILDEMLFAHRTKYVNPVDDTGLSHFHIACFNDNHRMVLGFLKHGVELNNCINFDSKYWPGCTPLHIASMYSCLTTSNLLVQFDADIINAKNAAGLSPLHCAIKNGDGSLINLLFSYLNNNCINLVKSMGLSILHVYCIDNKESQSLDNVLRHKRDIHVSIRSDSPVWAGYKPLHVAVHNKRIYMINLLVQYGADINAEDANGISPLQLAIRKRLINKGFMNLLLYEYYKTTILSAEDVELFELFCACMGQKIDLIQRLLNNKLNINRTVPQKFPLGLLGYTPLHFAVERGDAEIVELLLKNGADLCIQDANQLSPLHLAVQRKNFCVVRKILSFYDEVTKNPIDFKGLSHLHIACMIGMTDLVNKFLQYGAAVNLTTKDGQVPLHFAVRSGSEKTVKLLLEHKADFTAQEINGLTPLHIAVQIKNKNIIKMILSLHDQKIVNPVSKMGLSHFHIACMKNKANLVEAFLQSGLVNHHPIQLTSAIYAGFTPLHFAVKYNCTNTIRVLLHHGVNIATENALKKLPLHYAFKSSFQDSNLILDLFWSEIEGSDIKFLGTTGLSILHIACMRDDFCAVEKLLKQKSNVHHCTNLECPLWPKYSPLHFAAKYGTTKTIDLLLDYKSNPNITDKYGFTPLHIACSRSKPEIVQKLLASGCDPTLKSINGLTPLRLALQANNEAIVQAILSHPFSRVINPIDNKGQTYFHVVILKNLTSAVEDFLNSGGINIDEPIHPAASSKFSGCTPLHIAVSRQDIRLVELLLKHGANPDVRNIQGESVLEMAVKYNRLKVLKLALHYGADPNLENHEMHDQQRPLELTIKLRREKMMELLLESGADATVKAIDGSSFVHRTIRDVKADEDYYVRVFLRLLEHGCDVDTTDNDTKSPLHRAYWPLNFPALRALLRCGANVDVEDRSGRSVISYLLEIRTSRMPVAELRRTFREHLEVRRCIAGLGISGSNEKLYRTLVQEEESEEEEILKSKRTPILPTTKHPQHSNQLVSLNTQHQEPRSSNNANIQALCSAELQIMRSTYLGSYTSLHDMFRQPKKMAWCLENPDLLDFLRTNRVELQFPKCSCLLRMQYARALCRRRLLQGAMEAIDRLMFGRFEVARGRDECARAVLEYLGNEDLSSLTALV